MEISLINRRALVGGGTSGIGKAIAIQLARCGAEVHLLSRNEDKLKQTCAELDRSFGQQHDYIVADFNNFEQSKQNILAFLHTNPVDILINNTQGPSPGQVKDKDGQAYQEAFDLLFQNAVWLSTQVLPYMKERGYGRIVNVSSMTVKEPQDNLVLSNTMRTALVSWAKSLSNAVAQDGITVNSVLTGFFDTDRLNSLMKGQADKAGVSFEEIHASRVNSIPVKRLGKPEEYGFLVTFLASEYASFITGASIPLDGGASKTIF